MAELVVDHDGLDDAGNGFGAERSDTSGDDGVPSWQVVTQLIVERTNSVRGETSWLCLE